MAEIAVAVGAVVGWVGATGAVATIATATITGALVGALVGAAVGGLTALVTGGDIGQGILNGAIGGAVSGAVLGFVGGAYSAMTTEVSTGLQAAGEATTTGGLEASTQAADLGLNADSVIAGVGDAPVGTLDAANYATPGVTNVGPSAGGAGGGAPAVQSEGILDGLSTKWDGLSDMSKQVAMQGVSGVASGLLDNSAYVADSKAKADLDMNAANNLAAQDRQDANARDQLKLLWEQQSIREHNNALRSDTQQRLTAGV